MTPAQPKSDAVVPVRRWRRAWPFLLLIAAATGALWLGVIMQQPSGLVVKAEFLDFGQVWADPRFEWVFPIENHDAEDIEITGFRSSCACVSIEPKSVMIRQGESVHIKLTIDLTKLKPSTDVTTYSCSVSIAPVVTVTRFATTWTIRGTVREAFTFAPANIDFGTLHRAHKVHARECIATSYSGPVNDVTATCDPSILNVEIGLDAHTAPDSFFVRATPHDDLPSGPFKCDIRMTATTSSGEKLKGFVVANGQIVDDIHCVPEHLSFGIHELGAVSEQTVVLQSRSSKDFDVLRWSVKGTNSAPEPIVTEIERGRVYQVRQEIAQTGFHTTELVFSVQEKADPSRGAYAVRTVLSYHGVARGNGKGLP
jgi:hypothetical protein